MLNEETRIDISNNALVREIQIRKSEYQSITRRQNFRQVQIDRNCRQHLKVHLK